MKRKLSIMPFFTRCSALLLLICLIAGSSYADTLFPDYSSADVCVSCHYSRSKENTPGKHAPAPDNHSDFMHFHCHNQPASLNAASLNSLDIGNRLKRIEDTPALFQFAAPIFHPPQIHI